jgi:PAS domain-containing protein
VAVNQAACSLLGYTRAELLELGVFVSVGAAT